MGYFNGLIVLELAVPDAQGRITADCVRYDWNDERFYVTWEATTCPPDFSSVQDGVVFVKVPPGYQDYKPLTYQIDYWPTNDSAYRFAFDFATYGLLVAVLPMGYIIGDAKPAPLIAKDFKGRVAVLWRFRQTDAVAQSIIDKTPDDAKSAAQRINAGLDVRDSRRVLFKELSPTIGEKLKLLFRQTASLGYLLVPGLGFTALGATWLVINQHSPPLAYASFILGIVWLSVFVPAVVFDLLGMIPPIAKARRHL